MATSDVFWFSCCPSVAPVLPEPRGSLPESDWGGIAGCVIPIRRQLCRSGHRNRHRLSVRSRSLRYMASGVAWLSFDAEQQRRTQLMLAALSNQGTVDELGLGVFRDLMACHCTQG